MGAGYGVDAPVGSHLEHRMTILVHNKNVAIGVGHGEVRAGKRGIGRVAAFKTRQPIIDSIHPAIRPATRDSVQQTVRSNQVGEGFFVR